jgi:IS30 family transposase
VVYIVISTCLKTSLGCGVYFADPYCSWRRGLNENTNGLLRQYWPKSANLKKVSRSEVQGVIVELMIDQEKTKL